MFRSSSPDDYNYIFHRRSLLSNISQEEPLSKTSSLSRPSGKYIYRQRKEFSETIKKQSDKFQHRVEHLLTCELDGRELRNQVDCMDQLRMLDAKGQIWGQDMFLEVQGKSLLLTDIETKEELESLDLGSIRETKAVLNSCVYNSLLMITVQQENNKNRIFMFHCEEVGAEYVKINLERALQHKTEDVDHQQNISENVENIAGWQVPGSLQNLEPPQALTDRWTPQDNPISQWEGPNYEEDSSAPPTQFCTNEDSLQGKHMSRPQGTEEEESPRPSQPPQYTETQRKVDILNHLLNDVELFMLKVTAVMQKEKKKKKNIMKKKKAPKDMPPAEELTACLQKIKYGFNILGDLNGKIENPSVPDLIHCLFSSLSFLVPQYPSDLPPTVVSPLLTDFTIRLLSEEASTEEDLLWQSLGDAWNIPSSKWPDEEDIPPYILKFDDGWQPPPLSQDHPKENARPKNKQNDRLLEEPNDWPKNVPKDRPASRTKSQQVQSRTELRQNLEPIQQTKNSVPWNPTSKRSNNSHPVHMRALHEFTGRNSQELTVMKGDVLEVLDKTKQWWRVRNNRNQEGYVPNNILFSMEGEQVEQDMNSSSTLNKKSKPEDVKAWLVYKGFSKITIRCLSVLSGALLLGMTREELKIMCPEEGGRVFTQLQGVKSALMSERT